MTYLEQEKEIRKLIGRYGDVWMHYDNDAIGELIETMLYAEMKYNPQRGAWSTYLITSIKNKMRKLNIDKRKRARQFVNYKEPSKSTSEFVEVINNNNYLSALEKSALIQYYYHGYNMVEIGAKHNLTKQRIKQVLDSSITKLRRIKYVFMDK